jgi:predicted PurR-regulated permease PerM
MRNSRDAATVLLLALTALALYLSWLLFRPYAGPILFAAVTAIIFHPVHRYSQRIFPNRNAAAFASTLATMIVAAVPIYFVGRAVSNELADLYRSLADKSAAEGGPAASALHAGERIFAWMGQRFAWPAVDFRGMAVRRLEEASAVLVRMGANLVTNIFTLIADAVIAALVLFFLFRDGAAGLARLGAALPLGPKRFAELQQRINATVMANFYGVAAVGAVQGSLTALAFWVLGIGSPVLWGVVTALFSLIPVIGSATVWVPASLILLFSGHVVKGIILLAWGTGVVGLADNVVRPWIISERVRLHTIYVFFALLGGIQVFGVMGLFLGPVILSVTVALLGMLREDLQERAHSGTSNAN